MLVTFLGAPCSGKTTTAARLFADLKDGGYPAEFVAEVARQYIARMKKWTKETGHEFQLKDGDQWHIMKNQFYSEAAFAADPSVVTIADSSALNGMMYLSDENARKEISDIVLEEAKLVTVAFLCQPVLPPVGMNEDPNRVHSLAESRKLHDKLTGLIEQYYPNVKVVPLYGELRYRHTEAMRVVYELMNTF